MNKKMTTAVIYAVLTISLAACGSSDGSAPDSQRSTTTANDTSSEDTTSRSTTARHDSGTVVLGERLQGNSYSVGMPSGWHLGNEGRIEDPDRDIYLAGACEGDLIVAAGPSNTSSRTIEELKTDTAAIPTSDDGGPQPGLTTADGQLAGEPAVLFTVDDGVTLVVLHNDQMYSLGGTPGEDCDRTAFDAVFDAVASDWTFDS